VDETLESAVSAATEEVILSGKRNREYDAIILHAYSLFVLLRDQTFPGSTPWHLQCTCFIDIH